MWSRRSNELSPRSPAGLRSLPVPGLGASLNLCVLFSTANPLNTNVRDENNQYVWGSQSTRSSVISSSGTSVTLFLPAIRISLLPVHQLLRNVDVCILACMYGKFQFIQSKPLEMNHLVFRGDLIKKTYITNIHMGSMYYSMSVLFVYFSYFLFAMFYEQSIHLMQCSED